MNESQKSTPRMIVGMLASATLVLSAMVVPGAFASGEQFHSNNGHTILSTTAISTQRLTTTAGNFECTQLAIDSATMASSTATAITASPTYSTCIGVIESPFEAVLEVRVTRTSCDFVFTSDVPAEKNHSPLHIECATDGDEIDFEVRFLGTFRPCLKVPSQTPNGGVGYGSNDDHLGATFTMANIQYTEAGVCGSTSTPANATYSGQLTVSGKDTEGNTAPLSWG